MENLDGYTSYLTYDNFQLCYILILVNRKNAIRLKIFNLIYFCKLFEMKK